MHLSVIFNTDTSDSSYVPNTPLFGPCSVIVTGTDPVPSKLAVAAAIPNALALLDHPNSCVQLKIRIESSLVLNGKYRFSLNLARLLLTRQVTQLSSHISADL